MRAISYLNDTGAFLITKSGPKVCKYFGISKYTLYSYLDEAKLGRVIGGDAVSTLLSAGSRHPPPAPACHTPAQSSLNTKTTGYGYPNDTCN